MAKEGEELSGLQKTAILLISLGPERSSKIFKHLKEEGVPRTAVYCGGRYRLREGSS